MMGVVTTPTLIAHMATSRCREIITIQCGHYANHVGTHWWNLQEAGLWYPPLGKDQVDNISSDCTFREGITLTGKETYTPRLIAIDLSGSLESLKQDGSLYNNEAPPTSVWAGPVETIATDTNESNEYIKDLEEVDTGKIEEEEVVKKSYDLDSSVRVWSDFLRPHLHPKSLAIIPGYFHEDERFNAWPSGVDTWNDRQFRLDLEDRLHFFLEECDSFQGFQLLYDHAHGGFSSLASSFVQYLQEEFGTKTIMSFSVTPPTFNDSATRPLQYTMDSLLSIANMYECCSLLVPLSVSPSLWPTPTSPPTIPSINYTPCLDYHTSAILSVAMETITSCYRSPLYQETMGSVCGLLGNCGRRLASMSLTLPADLSATDNTPPTPSGGHAYSLDPALKSVTCLTPHCSTSGNHDDRAPVLWGQCVGVRGYQSNSSHSSVAAVSDPYAALIHQLYTLYPSTNSQLSVYSKPLIATSPFPNIVTFDQPPGSLHRSVNSLATLQIHSGIYNLLQSLITCCGRGIPRLVPAYNQTCLDDDTYQELISDVTVAMDTYKTGPPSDCSTDD